MHIRVFCLSILLAMQIAFADSQPPSQTISLMHWWVSDAEQDALSEIFDEAKAQGVVVDAIAFPSHRDLREGLSDLLRVGQPPHFSQWIASGDLETLMLATDTILTWPDFSDRVFPELRDMLSIGDDMGAIPVVTHIQNAMFVNQAVLNAHGLTVPTDWQSFVQTARSLEDAGVQSVITSHEPWQIRMLFDDIMLGLGGADLYRDFYNLRTSDALRDVLVQSFELLFEIRGYQRPSQPEIWSDIAHQFGRDEIGFFFLGDFAWAKLIRAPGINISDFDCKIAPGSGDVLVYATDIFIGFHIKDDAQHAQQVAFGEVILHPDVQRAFVAKKGGMPVILGLESDSLAPCARFAHELWLNDKTVRMPTPWSFNRAALNYLESVIAEVWFDHAISAEGASDRLLTKLDAGAPLKAQVQK